MEGYEVVTTEGRKLGHVTRVEGDIVVVEHGALLKHRNALPLQFVHVDNEEQVVRTTLTKNVVVEAPKVDGDPNDPIDEAAVAAYYGLSGGMAEPGTEGEGVLDDTDPARTSEQDARRLGVASAEEERVRIRKGSRPGEGPADEGRRWPGFTGGDRLRDAEGVRDPREQAD